MYFVILERIIAVKVNKVPFEDATMLLIINDNHKTDSKTIHIESEREVGYDFGVEQI